MKLAKYGMGLFTSLILTLGVSYQVKAHEGSHIPAEAITGDLTEEKKDELIELYLKGLPELPITEADINSMGQQLQHRLSVKDDSMLPNVFILPEDIKLPPTIPGEWVAAPGGDAFQFNIVGSPLSTLDQPITNAISTSEYDTPFTAGIAFIPPKTGGPLPHVHWWEDEWYWVLKGNLDWYVGDNMYYAGAIPGVNAPLEDHFHHVQLGTGELVYSHENHLHAYQNNTDETSILIHFWRRLDQTDGGIEQFFLDKEIGRLVESPSAALPPNGVIDLEWAAKWIKKFPEYGATSSAFFNEYLTENALVEGLDPQKLKDNNAEELVALLRQIPQFRQTPQTRAVPEPSVTFGLLAFGGLFAISTLKRKNKCIRLGIVNLN